MCRSIIQLRRPEGATADDARAAALQYVRKVSGYRAPSRVNAAAFERAVAEISGATLRLLDQLAAVKRQTPPG